MRAQLRSLFFGQRIVDEHACARFGTGEIFQLRRGSERRVKLYVKVVVIVAARIGLAQARIITIMLFDCAFAFHKDLLAFRALELEDEPHFTT